MAFLSFPYGWPWGISRDAPPPPPESVRTFARSLVRLLAGSYAEVISKFSRLNGLPIFLTHLASLERFARWSSAKNGTRKICKHASTVSYNNQNIPILPTLSSTLTSVIPTRTWQRNIETNLTNIFWTQLFTIEYFCSCRNNCKDIANRLKRKTEQNSAGNQIWQLYVWPQ